MSKTFPSKFLKPRKCRITFFQHNNIILNNNVSFSKSRARVCKKLHIQLFIKILHFSLKFHFFQLADPPKFVSPCNCFYLRTFFLQYAKKELTKSVQLFSRFALNDTQGDSCLYHRLCLRKTSLNYYYFFFSGNLVIF